MPGIHLVWTEIHEVNSHELSKYVCVWGVTRSSQRFGVTVRRSQWYPGRERWEGLGLIAFSTPMITRWLTSGQIESGVQASSASPKLKAKTIRTAVGAPMRTERYQCSSNSTKGLMPSLLCFWTPGSTTVVLYSLPALEIPQAEDWPSRFYESRDWPGRPGVGYGIWESVCWKTDQKCTARGWVSTSGFEVGEKNWVFAMLLTFSGEVVKSRQEAHLVVPSLSALNTRRLCNVESLTARRRK